MCSGIRKPARCGLPCLKEMGMIVVSVLDDGKGIDERIAELRPEKVGVGIGGMKQRAREFGGELRLRNADPGTAPRTHDSVDFGVARAKHRVEWMSLTWFVSSIVCLQRPEREQTCHQLE